MARPLNKLTTIFVAKKDLQPGAYEDGGGLRLMVEPGGSRSWALRVTVRGVRKAYGLGGYPGVSLKAARERATAMRQAAKDGLDPKEVSGLSKALGVTFEQAFETYFAKKERMLSNGKHRAQWRSTMQTYVFPVIGKRPIDEIRPDEIDAILEPIWHTKSETAHRVLQRMQAVFTDAVRLGHRTRALPTIGATEAHGRRRPIVRHHPSMPYADVPDFIKRLRASKREPIVKLMLEFILLSACRSGEARMAQWDEIDVAAALWTVPAERMKGRKEHTKPLGPRCLAILAEARALRPDATLVFPIASADMPYSDMALNKLMRDFGYSGIATPHGFRSTLKDWSLETGVARDEVSEAVLAHTDRNRVRAAYARTTFLDERRKLIAEWENYACEGG